MNQKLTLYTIPDYTTASRTLRHDPKLTFGSRKILEALNNANVTQTALQTSYCNVLKTTISKKPGFWNIITCEI